MMNFNDTFKGIFGSLDGDMCRLTMNGKIAVKTSSGYKSYNVKTGRLVNCSSFVFNIGEEFFFVIPTNKVEKGDIILVNSKPRCVVESKKNQITVINYEDSTVETILPDRHVFMGNTYFYGKIVSMFRNDLTNGKKGMNKIMQYMMMSKMMGEGGLNGSNGTSGMNQMLPFMMMGGMGNGFGNMFGSLFDDAEDDEEDEDDFFDGIGDDE